MLPRPFPLLLVLAACSANSTTPQLPPSVATLKADPQANPTTQDDRMAWWRDARFGMFIHWGLYAIPAGEWQGQKDYGEWIRDSAKIPVGTYEKFRSAWNPVHFDADAWASMAAAAGMKYLVITSKHHDGFCLFDSKETDWDAMNTPYGRDILKELSAACARHGVVFCTYHSIMDWHHPDYLPRRPWELKDRTAEGADFTKFEKYLHAQVTEVITNYHPAVMWFDGEWESTWNHERGQRLFELCRKLAPGMLVNNRVDVHRGGMGGFSGSSEAYGDFATPEQEIPATGMPGVDWESCMTMNRHWGWNQADKDWKSTKELLRNLVDIASKGGNYLLNIGPRADGTFPPLAVQRLAEIGAWMKQNGESIHGTTASVFDSLPFGRCTVKRNGPRTTLYFHVFDWPASREIVVPGLGNDVLRAWSLAMPNVGLPAKKVDGDWRIHVPVEAGNDPIDTVVALEIAGAPVIYKAPVVTAESDSFVRRLDVSVCCGEGLEVRCTTDGSEPGAASPKVDGPLHLATTTTVKARAFHRGRPVSPVTVRTFTKVTPSPAVEPVAKEQGLRLQKYEVDWNTIRKDLDALHPVAEDAAATVTCGKAPGEHVALRFRGFLDVPEDEVYRFELTSDDGSVLWLDGVVAIDNDGLHGAVAKGAALALGKGLHPIEVVWFNKTGGAELKLRWAKPGAPFAEVPAAALRR